MSVRACVRVYKDKKEVAVVVENSIEHQSAQFGSLASVRKSAESRRGTYTLQVEAVVSKRWESLNIILFFTV